MFLEKKETNLSNQRAGGRGHGASCHLCKEEPEGSDWTFSETEYYSAVFRRRVDLGGGAFCVLSDEEPDKTNLQTFSVELFQLFQTNFRGRSERRRADGPSLSTLWCCAVVLFLESCIQNK